MHKIEVVKTWILFLFSMEKGKQNLKENLLSNEEQKVAKNGEATSGQEIKAKEKKEKEKKEQQDHAWGTDSRESKGV